MLACGPGQWPGFEAKGLRVGVCLASRSFGFRVSGGSTFRGFGLGPRVLELSIQA